MADYYPGLKLMVAGHVTKAKFIQGRPLYEIERILGFEAGSFQQGAVVVRLDRLPDSGQFETAGYTQISADQYHQPSGLDQGKLKALAHQSWSVTGPNSLVKIRSLGAMPDRFPPGLGAPQWLLTSNIWATVIDVIESYPDGRFVPKL